MMKRSKVLIMLALLGASAVFTDCSSPSPAPSDPQHDQLVKLSHTWKATEVKLDGSVVTGYETFTLTITNNPGDNDTFNFTTANRPAGTPTPWPQNGQWTFGSDFATLVIRSDYNLPVTYSLNSTASILSLSFDYSDCPNTPGVPCVPYTGRTGNVSGQWSFTMAVQ